MWRPFDSLPLLSTLAATLLTATASSPWHQSGAPRQGAAANVGAGPAGAAAQDGSDPIALRLNDREIARSTYEDWLLLNHGELDAPTFARTMLLRERAEALGVTPDPGALRQQALADLESRRAGAFGGDEQRWRAELEREGRTPAGRLAERMIALEREALAEALTELAPKVDEAQVVALWEDRFGTQGRSPRVRIIRKRFVVPFQPGEDTGSRRARSERLRADRRAEMDRLRERIEAGESFEEIARKESDHPSRSSGGLPADAAWEHGFPRAPLSRLAQEDEGSLSEVIFSAGAFWILQLAGVHVTPLDEVRADLEAELLARAASDGERAAMLVGELLRDNPLQTEAALLDPFGTPPEAVLFRVGDHAVTRAEFTTWQRRLRGESEAQRFALELRLHAAAAAAAIGQPPKETIARGVERARSTDIELSSGGDEAAWLARLEAQGISLDAWNRAARRRILLEALEDSLARRSRVLTEGELRSAWEERFGPGGLRTHVRWIQLRVPAPAADVAKDQLDAERKRLERETLERARQLRSRVIEGQDFAELARTHSEDPTTAESGGAPHDGFRIASLPAELLTQVHALEEGDQTEATLLAAGDSVVLLQLVGREQVELEDARSVLEAQLADAAATLTERATIRAELARDLDLEIHTEALLE